MTRSATIRLILTCGLLVGAGASGGACSDDSTPAADATSSDAVTHDGGPSDGTSDVGPAGQPPAIDGLFEDWRSLTALTTDPAGDASGGFDLTTVKAQSRGTTVYLYFDVGKLLNASGGPTSEGTLRIELTPSSGQKLTIDLRGRTAWVGSDSSKTLRWSELAYALAPTYASKTFEARVDLAAVGAKLGDTVSINFGGSDALAAPANLKLSAAAVAPPAARSTDRASGAAFRVASLNTWYDGLTDPSRGVAFGRLIKAVAADIYCFQEVVNGTAAGIASALTTLDPLGDGATWSAYKVGDSLVATRGTLKGLPAQGAGQQHAGAAIDIGGGSVVVFTVRPVCCGYIGDPADIQRINEMKTMAATIQKLRTGQLGADLLAWKDAPVVVVGDWNLVGSRTPLDVMLAPTSSGGPGLTHWLLRHLRGDDVFTWYLDKAGEFPPGMLDVLVHSPDLTARHGFVLDTAELDATTLTQLKLQPTDSQASDHLMLVADLGTGSAP